ncbi:MAG TPA: LysE family transporter [Chthoniobacterales bacterium]|nr:LysE family transporter [Chthoniobacterales bacterium]
MSLSGFIGYSCALAIAAIIPGPQIFAIIAQALRRGFGRAAWMTLGMVLGDVLFLINRSAAVCMGGAAAPVALRK